MRLTIGYPPAPAWLLGAFQRTSEIPDDAPRLKRASGGGAVRIGPGTLWLQLELDLDLGSLPADKLLNRQVRPLLKALTRVTSKPAHYFGRDWVALAHRPVAFVGFAHSAEQNRGVFEAIVAVDAPLAPRPSFRDKSPVALEADPTALLDAVVEAYGVETVREVPAAADIADEPAWAATLDEALGTIAAGPDASGRMRVGGELMASSDAVARLEAALAAGAGLEGAINDAFRGATIFGARLESIRDVIVEARAASELRAPHVSPRG